MAELEAMKQWLLAAGCTHVVMESTGSYWKPIFNVLEDANVKLGSVLSDVFGVSGQLMPEALLEGQATPDQIAQLAQQRARKKIPEIIVAHGVGRGSRNGHDHASGVGAGHETVSHPAAAQFLGRRVSRQQA
jgi:hypothetical protein